MTSVRTDYTTYTDEGHLVGMLDRDLRTAKIRYTCQRPQVFYAGEERSRGGVTTPARIPMDVTPLRSRKLRKSHYSWKNAQRLRNVLIVCVYLSFFNVPSISSAPTHLRLMGDRARSTPKWINPCGKVDYNNTPQPHEGCENQQAPSSLAWQIAHQAKMAISKANEFKDDYVTKTFHNNFEDHLKKWNVTPYDWLSSMEQIPKSLGENLSKEYLESLEFDQALLDSYEYLQRIAVGLEQIVWDMEDQHVPFAANFTECEMYLKSTLCEMWTAIVERCMTMRPDITRDIMDDTFRKMPDNTQTNIRNWVIFREYLNALEYVHQVFGALHKRL